MVSFVIAVNSRSLAPPCLAGALAKAGSDGERGKGEGQKLPHRYGFSSHLLALMLGSIPWSAATIPLAAGQSSTPFDWKVAPPESEGFSAQALAARKDTLASRTTTGFLLIRHDRIACEGSSTGFNA